MHYKERTERMGAVIRWGVMFLVMFPFVMVINQCGYNNCYRSDCIAAAMTPVSMFTLLLSLVAAVFWTLSDRK
jgi:hypothetical protein